MQTRAKRLKLRRRQPRYAGNNMRSLFRAAPRKPKPSQPYLGSGVDLAELLG